MAEEQTTLWPKEKIPKEYSESVYGRRTDNTMAKRKFYQYQQNEQSSLILTELTEHNKEHDI
jgi:hypothetical protein